MWHVWLRAFLQTTWAWVAVVWSLIACFVLYWSVIWSWLTWELFCQYKYQQVPTGNLLDDSEGEEVVYHSDSERSHYDPEPEVTLGLQTVLTPQRVWLHLMTLCDLYFSAPVCELFIRFWRREGEK